MVGLRFPSLFAAFPRAESHKLAFTVTFTDVTGEDQKGPEATRNILKETRTHGPQTRVQSWIQGAIAVFESAGRPFESGRVRHSQSLPTLSSTVVFD